MERVLLSLSDVWTFFSTEQHQKLGTWGQTKQYVRLRSEVGHRPSGSVWFKLIAPNAGAISGGMYVMFLQPDDDLP